MSNYVVTNIRLAEEDYLRLKEEAARGRKSFSAVIREKISIRKADDNYAAKLLSVSGNWFDKSEYDANRTELDKRLSFS